MKLKSSLAGIAFGFVLLVGVAPPALAEQRPVPLPAPDFVLDVDAVMAAVQPNTKAVLDQMRRVFGIPYFLLTDRIKLGIF